MRTIAAWSLILWFALVCEQARPDVLKPGALMIPCAVICIFRLRNGTGIVVAGLALILQSIVNPNAPPIEVATVLLLSCILITTRTHRDWRKTGRLSWMWPVVVTAAGEVVLSLTLTFGMDLQNFLTALIPRMAVAGPCAVVAALSFRIVDELVVRRPATV